MKPYNHQKAEKKWQKYWDEKKIYRAKDFSNKPKYYCLIEFPYPSGDGLHVGHIRSNTAMDILARKKRMEGKNVLYPIGWDAFGLPTENYAIKTGIHPKIVTKKNTDNFRRQLKSLGFSFDWSREINTTDPKYYKWTQWMFLQFHKHGLAYKKKMSINWCVSCKIGLANEEVLSGSCERCGGRVEKRDKEQWMLAITKYADKLIEDLDKVDYLNEIKTQQRNWIGKSEGVIVKFSIFNPPAGRAGFQFSNKKTEKEPNGYLEVFTTRVDTIFGVTYLVVAPEHSLIDNYGSQIENLDEVKKYVKQAKSKTDLQRTNLDKDKTGVELKGLKAVNPANGEELPVWVADYVLGGYGAGAVMAVPAHDERDREFAEKYNLPISNAPLVDKEEAIKKANGKKMVFYKLRDWVFSRQRYWGEPIPIIHCEKCGTVPVPEKDLPIKLPDVKNYQPTDTGESPLANIVKWVSVKCPQCGEKARRETDTMPNWAGSSWYFLRYLDPKNNKTFADKKKMDYWMPVDWYNGGMEHVTLHLLYSRFWNKFFHDIKAVPISEPYKKRTAHGLILAENGEKMSKSKGNVINPDEIVKEYGADALRLYEMFMGPFDQAIPWDTRNIVGVKRFLDRVWNLQNKVKSPKDDSLMGTSRRFLDGVIHKTIKKVSEDIENFRFNTAVSSLMILLNEIEKEESLSEEHYEIFILLLSPFAPHIAEEIWMEILGNKKPVHVAEWPKFDPEKIKEETFKLVVQVDGKTRCVVDAPFGISEEEAKVLTLKLENVKKYINGDGIKKVIFVPNKIINILNQK